MEAFQLATQLPGVFSPRKWTFAFLAWCLGFFFGGGGWLKGSLVSKGAVPRCTASCCSTMAAKKGLQPGRLFPKTQLYLGFLNLQGWRGHQGD